VIVVDDASIRRIAREARVVAVLGAHPDPSRPACYVPASLRAAGVHILPVNPACVGQVLHGCPVRSSLTELACAVDIVDVFRRTELIAGHVDEILAMRPPPRVVWLQSGLRDDASALRLSEAGIDVVQDRCLMVEARR
jgi:predicted CoA-binding protein